MKCQACEEQATHHVTELVAGKPEEYHVCEKHLQALKGLEPESHGRRAGFRAFWDDPEIREVLRDAEARQKMEAYLLPVLCLALLDDKPEVRILSAYRLMQLGGNAQSAIQALRNALLDKDERLVKAAQIAIEWIQTGQPGWFF
jgi:hypothetical protein